MTLQSRTDLAMRSDVSGDVAVGVCLGTSGTRTGNGDEATGIALARLQTAHGRPHVHLRGSRHRPGSWLVPP